MKFGSDGKMASRCLQSARFLSNRLKLPGLNSQLLAPLFSEKVTSSLIVGSQLVCIRHGSFFNKKSAKDIWGSVTGVSNQGRKRGRAVRSKLTQIINLSRGWRVGDGESGLVVPGLNVPVTSDMELNNQLYIPEKKDHSFKERMAKARAEDLKKRKKAVMKDYRSPLQRGYSGNKIAGKSIGPPDPIEGYTFEGFDTKVLLYKRVAHMTKSQGRIRTDWCLAVTGNKNGLVGFAVGKGTSVPGALRVAKNKSAQRLIHVPRYNDHTLYHNFYEKHHKTSIIAKQMPKGYGLVCHRAIKVIAELAGIEDMYCKTEGRTKNYLSLTKAFFHGLESQQTHQELADKLGYNVVEYRGERNNYPVVVASPKEKKETEFVRDENFDFDNYFYGGRVPLRKKKREPPHYNTKAYKAYLSDKHRRRNQRSAQIQRWINNIDWPPREKRSKAKEEAS